MSQYLKGAVDWERLHRFHAVAASGSFTRVGRKLGLSQSAVSRQIRALEESLGIPLFYRHARGLVLTEQGEELYRAVQEMSDCLSRAVQRIGEALGKPEGPLKITTTVAFGSAWLTSRINRFHVQYRSTRRSRSRWCSRTIRSSTCPRAKPTSRSGLRRRRTRERSRAC